MGLQSFLSHAQDDPGTQEAIRKLLKKDEPPRRFIASPSTDTPPTRDQIPYDDPNIDIPPERLAMAQPVPPVRMSTLDSTVTPPAPELSLAPPVRIDPRQGVSTAGMSSLDAAQARLNAVQGASPQSRVNNDDPNFTEIGPPHGISRLKAAGRLFLHNLTHGGGLLGGIVGLGEGLIAPGHAQDLKHAQEVAEAQGNFDQVTANAKNQAQIEDITQQAAERKRQSLLPLKLEPPHEDFRAIAEGEYPNVEAGTQIKRIWNGSKFVDELDAKGRPTIKALPPVREPKSPTVQWVENPDGSKTAFVPDPKSPTGWKHAGLPDAAKPPSKEPADSNQWQVTNQAIDENIAGFKARQAKIDAFLNGTPATITVKKPHVIGRTDEPPKVVPNPAYETAKKERNDLDNKIAEENGKRKAAPPVRASSGFKPASDGKFHYTESQIRQSLQPGQTYEDIYGKLKANKRVVIDE